MIAVIFVTPKAAAQHELLLNKPVSGFAKFIILQDMILVALGCAT
jgi:hypothetical protein